MDVSILNYFGQALGWDILLQGSFFGLCLSLSIFLLTNPSERTEDFFKAFFEKVTFFQLRLELSRKENSPHRRAGMRSDTPKFLNLVRLDTLILVGLFFLFNYFFGVVTNPVADQWIDARNIYHLGLKGAWVDPDYLKEENSRGLGYEELDEKIKADVFDKVYGEQCVELDSLKVNIYYAARHMLLKDKDLKGYVSYSQSLINISQVFALSFFIVFLSSIATYCLKLKSWSPEWPTIIMVVVLILPLLELIHWSGLSRQDFLKALDFVRSYFHFLLLIVLLVLFRLKFLNKLRKMSAVTIMVLFVLPAYFGYCLSSWVWVQNEKEINAKTYGALKVLPETVVGSTFSKEFEELENCIKSTACP